VASVYDSQQMTEGIDKQELFDSLPPPWPEPLLPQIRVRVQAAGECLVFLDDDPTGGQTLHGLPVLTAWDEATLDNEVRRSDAFFVVTNSRALREAEAVALAADAGARLRKIEETTGRRLRLGYRGDSTLRGHFPAETDALARALYGSRLPPVVFAPYFAEGGRFTVHDTQYVEQGPRLIPAAQTEFARDPRFTYAQSNLKAWIEVRTRWRVPAGDVVSVTIDDVRRGGPEAVAARLQGVPDGGVVIVNAACDRDLEVFVAGLLDAETAGRRFLYRTAASFVRVRAGIESRTLLGAGELRGGGRPGLVIAGSYAERTTRQLERLLALDGLSAVELAVERLVAGQEETQTRSVATAIDAALAAGGDVVVYTSRGFHAAPGHDPVAVGDSITRALCDVVGRLVQRPGFLLVKGGSTAYGIATRSLEMKRGVVLGQLLPGVPVWRLGAETRYPDLPLVIFPGNVGGPEALADAVRRLRGCPSAGPR
jgi:uncharacterized protein YgbK (DUF1537 family)